MNGAFAAYLMDYQVGRGLVLLVLLAVVLCCLPAYFLGYCDGKQVVYAEAVYRGAYSVTFDPKTGDKIQHWNKP